MNAKQTITIVSDDADFARVVADHAARELDVEACIAPEPAGDAALVVGSDKTAKSWPLPVLQIDPRDKPLRLQTLLAALRTLLNQTSVAIGTGYTLDMRQKLLARSAGGKTAELTDKEAQLLLAIAQAGGDGIGRDTLLKQVWGFAPDMNTHTLETHIYRLRAKIRENFSEEMIDAVEGGYRLSA